MSYGSVYDPGYGPGLLSGGEDISFGNDSLPAARVNEPGLDNSAQDEEAAYYASLPDSDPLKINWLQNQQSMGLANAYGGYQNMPYWLPTRDTMSWLPKYLPTVAGALAGYGIGAGVGALAGTAAGSGGAAAGAGVGSAGGTTAGTVGGEALGNTITILGTGAGTGGAAAAGGAAGGLLGAAAPPPSTPADPGNTVTVTGTPPTAITPADAGGLLGGGAGAITNPLDPNYNPAQDPSPDQTGQQPDTSKPDSPISLQDLLKKAGSLSKLFGSGSGASGANGQIPSLMGGSGAPRYSGSLGLLGSNVYGAPQGNLMIRAPRPSLSSLLNQ